MASRGEDKTDLLQGALELLVLQILQWGPHHGYAITHAIRQRSDELLRVETGSLYPALHRLERSGRIKSEWKTSGNKQRVKQYRITAAGRKKLSDGRSRWNELAAAIGAILNPQE